MSTVASSSQAERHITLDLSDVARANLVHTGYDPNYGARPLKRAIQKKIETPLGRLLIKGEVRDGQTIVVDGAPAGGDLKFTIGEPGELTASSAH